MTAGHAGDFPGGIQSRDRIEIFVQHATAEVGLDAAKVFARQAETVESRNRAGCRIFSIASEIYRTPVLARVRRRRPYCSALWSKKRFHVHLDFPCELGQGVGLPNIRRIVEQFLHFVFADFVAVAIIRVGHFHLRRHRRVEDRPGMGWSLPKQRGCRGSAAGKGFVMKTFSLLIEPDVTGGQAKNQSASAPGSRGNPGWHKHRTKYYPCG